MKKSLRVALVTGILAANCGGAEEPPPQQPAASTSVPPAETAPADKPASTSAPPSQTAPAPAQDAAADKTAPPKAPVARIAPETAPARPAYTRTDIQVGTGQEAQKGRRLSVHYTGWLYDPAQPEMKGRMIDSSRERGP
jgi:FKBP-type peptidyl-prolyl cis-trans isomerase